MFPKIIFALFISIPALAEAEYYKVVVKRIDSNLYKTADGLYIETKSCYEYATNVEAILKYEQYSYDNKLIFDNGTACDISKVFK